MTTAPPPTPFPPRSRKPVCANPAARLLAIATCAVIGGCRCEEKITTRQAVILFPAADGVAERTAFDFGDVQLNEKTVATVKVKNNGGASLVIDQVTLAAPFSFEGNVPVTIAAGDTGELAIGITPTELNVRAAGRLVARSNDPERPDAELPVFGRGIAAVVQVTPTPIAFGAVYVGDSKVVALKVTNLGTADLTITAAQYQPGTSSTASGAALTGLLVTLRTGETASVDVKYQPTAVETVVGGVELSYRGAREGRTVVPITGRSIQAVPALCFVYADGGEVCADSAKPARDISFGALCDELLYPPDGGPYGCEPGSSQNSGQVVVRNRGNTSVSYTMDVDLYPYDRPRCDGGTAESDIRWSGGPSTDGGAAGFTTPTLQLPLDVNQPQPWNSAPLALRYTAKSRCLEETADQASVLWLRQNDADFRTRAPAVLSLNLVGYSRVPRAVPANWGCGTRVTPADLPCEAAFFGAGNAGHGPLRVVAVEFVEEVPHTSGDGMGPTGGDVVPCTAGSPADSPCHRFAWSTADGGSPAGRLPVELPASDNGQTGLAQVGRLVFGPGGPSCATGGTCPLTEYTLYAKVTTDDPYRPVVYARITGIGANR